MENRDGYKKTELGWIPEEWEYCKFEDLTIEHKQGYYTKDEYSKDGIYLIRITDLQNPTVNFTNMPRLNIDEITFEQFKVETEDFLFARSGAIGRYGIISSKSPKAVFASYIIRFRFDKQKILNSFIGSFYSSQFCIRQLNSITQGSSNININANNIKSLMLPLPPLPEQQKIASILTTVDDKISSIEAQIQQTEQLKKGLMAKLLTEGIGHTEFKDTEIGRIPKGWEVVELSEYASDDKNSFVNGPFGSDLLSSELTNSGVPVIYIRDITTKQYTPISQVFVTQDKADSLLFCNVFKNDVLITKVGMPPGQATLYLNNERAIITQDVIRIRPNKNVCPFFLSTVLNSHHADNEIQRIEIKGTRTRFSLTEYKKIQLPFPPLPEQQQIASILSSVDDKLDVLQSKKTSYTTLKKGLMAKLLTGQMRVRI